jgi:hypothetical protein
MDAAVFIAHSYTVQSVVSVAAFEAFWAWLFVGRVRHVPREHAAECSLLAREFGIPTLEPEAPGLLDPCVEASLLDQMSSQLEGWCREMGAALDQLELRANARESGLRPQAPSAVRPPGTQDLKGLDTSPG